MGKPRTASAAVHRLALWAGDLSTAGATAHPLKTQWVNSGEQGWVNSRERQSQTRVSPGGGEFHITMHFDVGVATLVMLVTFAPRLGGRLLTPVSSPPPSQRTTALPEWFQLTAFSAAISCAVVGIAWTFGYVHPNPKLPVISGIYFIRTLIWTAILESCFFQSVLQDSLARLKMFHASNAAPLIIVAIIFGWLHDRHFGMYFWLASLAGTGYGFSYLRWRTIEAPVIVHTCLDCVHFFFFSYPFLKPTIS